MHSHTKKIEMCNAWLDLLNIGIIKMGFGFMRVLACEEKSNSSNICLQIFLFCVNLFLSAFFCFFCFLWWRGGRRVERRWDRKICSVLVWEICSVLECYHCIRGKFAFIFLLSIFDEACNLVLQCTVY